MPLNPINISKADSGTSSKIDAGRVVEYEQHSKSILGIALTEKKGKWAILNQHGAELELPVVRLYLLPGSIPDSLTDNTSKVAFLESLNKEASETAGRIDLEEVWQVLLGEVKETSVQEVTEFILVKDNLANHLAVRRKLLSDQVYFKRKKYGFEPRSESVVEELKVKIRAEEEKQRKKEEFIKAVLARLKNNQEPLPQGIEALEQAAALGKSAANAKETRELLTEILERAQMSSQGSLENKAFQVLVAMKHFAPDHNLVPLRLGRPVVFRKEIIDEAVRVAAQTEMTPGPEREDLRSLAAITIDGIETRDFDDALSLEEIDNGYRIGIHISDVSAVIAENSLLEDAALRRGTSIYCPDEQLPMLPPEVSEHTLSLIEGAERSVMSFFVDLDRELNITDRRICRSLIHITKRLTYEEADSILCDDTPQSTEFNETLLRLWEVCGASEARRLDAGAVQFGRREMSAKILPDGIIELEPNNEDTPARKLVSELMILANETAALFAQENAVPLVFRSQQPPDVDVFQEGQEVPEGPAREYYQRGLLKRSAITYEAAPHFGLGLEAYTQVTSPIRRAIDLINQRQLGAYLDRSEILFQPLKILELLAQIETGLDEANQIQRERNRYWLLKYLIQENIKEIDGVVVRTDGPRPLAELDILYSLYPFHPLDKRSSSGENAQKDLGRRVRLKIDSINPRSQTLVLREIE